MANVSPELRATGHRLCKEYLGGTWANISLDQFGIEVLRGGLSNHLFLCSLPEDVVSTEQEPKRVLLRIYGQILQENPETVLTDSLTFALLAEKKLGPKMYGAFTVGRLEEFVKGSRPLRTEELHDKYISQQCARKMAHFHRLHMPTVKQPKWLAQTMTSYMEEIKDASFPEGSTKAAMFSRIMSHNLIEEFSWLLNLVTQTHSPIVFCHNDLQEGNVLILPSTKEEPRIMPIDFEYSSYNYRGFDIANHFCEWCYDYTTDCHPYFQAKIEDYPSEAQQRLFFKAYLEAYTDIEDKLLEEEKLLHEVAVHTLVSHFFWCLWSVVQATKSDIKFGYLEYGEERLKAYVQQKQFVLDKTGGAAAAANDTADLMNGVK